MTDTEAALFALGIAGQLADAHTTKIALEGTPDASEANPLARGILSLFGYPGLYLVKLGVSLHLIHDAVSTTEPGDFHRQEVGFVLALTGGIPALNNAAIHAA